MRPFSDQKVACVFDSYDPARREKLMKLRELVFATAQNSAGVGEIAEVLRWGQPSYLTLISRSGSMVRMDVVKNEPKKIALYFHCQTGLIDGFRNHFSDVLSFAGNRAIILDIDEPLPVEALAYCIKAALRYRLKL